MWDKLHVSFPRKQPLRWTSAGMTSTEEQWQEHLWDGRKAGLGRRKHFKGHKASAKTSADPRILWNWGVPAELVQTGDASQPQWGGICLEEAATFGWGGIQGKDSAGTCQQATFPANIGDGHIILKEKHRWGTTAPTKMHRKEAKGELLGYWSDPRKIIIAWTSMVAWWERTLIQF